MAVKIKDQHEEIYVPALDLTFTSNNFGWSRFICRGEIIMTCLSSVRAWREKSGLDIKKLSLEYQEEFSNAYGKTMIITLSDGTELDAWVESQRFKHIIFAPPEFGGLDLREFIGQEGRAPVKGEPLKIGSIVNFNGQTLYVNCPYGGGVLINSDGSLDDKRVSLHPFVEGIISGYAIVKRCDGFKIIKSGSIEHNFPSSMLD